MNCPNCKYKLIKKNNTGENVKYCSKCGSSWFILLTSMKKEKSMWNKLSKLSAMLHKLARWLYVVEHEKKPVPIPIEEQIKNSKDYQNRI